MQYSEIFLFYFFKYHYTVDVIKIQNDEEYHKLLDAVSLYHKKILARRENLVGTYWKQTTFAQKDTPSYGDIPESIAYMFVTDVLGKTCELKIIKSQDNVWISSATNMLYINVLETKNEKTQCISQEQFIAETDPLLKQYGLSWN